MTEIQITPRYSDVKPQRYYVYLHRRKSDGTIFHVGKGHANRAWKRSSRNPKWTNTARKNGVIVQIVAQNLSEHESFMLETCAIRQLKSRGFELCNMSDGGEGPSGFKASLEQRIYNSRVRGGYSVCCSNGMVFDTLSSAVGWLKDNGFPRAANINISKCVKGKRETAYSFSWWRLGDDEKAYIPRYDKSRRGKKKIVIMDDSVCFMGLADAAFFVRPLDKNRNAQRYISLACSGKIDMAYGHKWSFA